MTYQSPDTQNICGRKFYLTGCIAIALLNKNFWVAFVFSNKPATNFLILLVVVCPEPGWRCLSLLELRQRLGLDRALMGSKARRVFYRDRYLDGKGAKILADLLQSDGLDSNSDVTIFVLQNSKSQSASELKAELEKALVKLTNMGVTAQVKVQPWHQRVHFPHARELEIQRQDGQTLIVIFDKGMGCLEVDSDGKYRRIEPTYMVITTRD